MAPLFLKVCIDNVGDYDPLNEKVISERLVEILTKLDLFNFSSKSLQHTLHYSKVRAGIEAGKESFISIAAVANESLDKLLLHTIDQRQLGSGKKEYYLAVCLTASGKASRRD